MGTYVFDVYTNVVYEVCVDANNMKEAKNGEKAIFRWKINSRRRRTCFDRTMENILG